MRAVHFRSVNKYHCLHDQKSIMNLAQESRSCFWWHLFSHFKKSLWRIRIHLVLSWNWDREVWFYHHRRDGFWKNAYYFGRTVRVTFLVSDFTFASITFIVIGYVPVSSMVVSIGTTKFSQLVLVYIVLPFTFTLTSRTQGTTEIPKRRFEVSPL